MTKICKRCKQEKEVFEFCRDPRNGDGLVSQCHSCRNDGQRKRRKVNLKKYRRTEWRGYLRRHYNLSIEEWESILTSQDNRCAICGSYSTGHKKLKNFCLDHNHSTGKLRGILCFKCNALLGLAKENKQTLQNAIDYLEKWENG